jgi:sugar O-acyltransferase (sialic acid O-acetyltransferase NeuD family)
MRAKIAERYAMSDNLPLLIYGTGQHGRVVAETADAADRSILGFVEQEPRCERVGRWPVFKNMPTDIGRAALIVAIGDNMARRRISGDLSQMGVPGATVIHPTAWVSPSATLGSNVYIGAQCVINAGAQIADGTIINSGAIIEHDCVIGAYTHIAPGATLAGEVRVGELCLIGAGAVIKPRMRIGDDCTVGAGAVVIDHVTNNQTVVGVPARPMEQRLRAVAG